MSPQDLCVTPAIVAPAKNPVRAPTHAPSFLSPCVPRAISSLEMRQMGRVVVVVESPSARKVSVSAVAATTLPVADPAPRNRAQLSSIRELILTREPSATGQSGAGAFCADRGEAATKVAIQSTLAIRNFFSVLCSPVYAKGPASTIVNPAPIYDNTFRATTLLAKCASRYENAPEKYNDTPGYSVPEGQPVVPLTSAEMSAIRAHHPDAVIYERP